MSIEVFMSIFKSVDEMVSSEMLEQTNTFCSYENKKNTTITVNKWTNVAEEIEDIQYKYWCFKNINDWLPSTEEIYDYLHWLFRWTPKFKWFFCVLWSACCIMKGHRFLDISVEN